ncbi:uncharacterized protein I206_103584 [Kwoniella pini CBS 10737]|uniref:Protein CPL1-like domain-containing protein n=1 Tax=Kwoniella pini CBS 10737 TaxID=1296096 RepID=A0AAJ8L5D4_9TREE
MFNAQYQLLIALTAVASYARGVYVGCFDREAIFQGASGQYLYSGEDPPSIPCDCQSIGYNFSYQYQQYGGTRCKNEGKMFEDLRYLLYETCFCTNFAPDYEYYLDNWNLCDAGVDSPGEAYFSTSLNAFCPAGTTACLLKDNDEDSYECIDTMNELESCGGCLNGRVGNAGRANPNGTDCTSLQGVSITGVACINGNCEVLQCAEGYDLRKGQCIPNNNH